MKRLALVVVLALVACSPAQPTPSPSSVSSASSTPSPTPTVDQAGQIRQTFMIYVHALRTKDVDKALNLTATKAFDQWEAYRKHALTSTEAQLAALPPGQRLNVYAMRATVDPTLLRSGTGREVMKYAIEQGHIVVSTSTKQVQADGTTTTKETVPVLSRLILGGDTATAEVGSLDSSVPASSTPLKFAFVREDGKWKADPGALAETTTAALEQRGVPVEQAITEALTASFGAARAAELRKPVGG